MAVQLRDFQHDLVDDIYAEWRQVQCVLAVLPTGGGKTFCFSWIVHDHDGASAIVVHRKEILSQISLSLAKLDVVHRIVAPPDVVTMIRRKHLKVLGKSFVDPHARCGVASAQTLTSASTQRNAQLQSWLQQVTLAVFDEGHHYTATGSWAKAVEMFGDAKVLFVTATPDRADGQGLGRAANGYCDVMVQGPQTQFLIDNKSLAPFKYFAPTTDLDVSGLAVTKGGDFNAKALRERVVDSHLVGDVVSQYQQFAPSEQTIVFAPDVATAKEIAAEFNARGIRAVELNGKTDARTREAELLRFESGDLQVLVNCALFDEGFDVPAATCAILAAPTESLARYLQQCGRVLRYLQGKVAKIIDPVCNWERHGMPNWPRVWSLESRSKRDSQGADDLIAQKVCTKCSQPYEAFYVACPHCGHVPVPAERSAPDKVDGDLFELDVEGMAALFAKMQKADQTDDEYRADLFKQNDEGKIVPPKFHGQAVRRHQSNRYRRQVLKELVGWWIGCQPEGRPLNEKHRRFFHRFGIDIGYAFTLPAKDTDALIDTIRRLFSEDMTV